MTKVLRIAILSLSIIIPSSFALIVVDPAYFLIHLGDGISRGATGLTAFLCVHPPDIVRLLIILMAFHYLLERPATLRKMRAIWKSGSTMFNKILAIFSTLGHFSMRVVVLVLFCLIVEGAPHFMEQEGHALGA